MSESVRYEQDGGVVVLTLNEPDTRNAISPAIVDALVAHVARINADLSVGCVILTGAGTGFSSGGNVKRMQQRAESSLDSPVDIRRSYQNNIQRVPLALYNLEAPLIAAVNGAAVGVGCDLATMCDIRIAARSAKFAESFLRVGLISGDGGAWYLPRVIGMARACEMTFTGRFVDAEEAERFGLVSRVVEDEQLLPAAHELARQIAAQPVHSLRLSKRLMRDSQQVSLPISLDMASSMQALAHHTHDQQEAILAFMEKRSPAFRGC